MSGRPDSPEVAELRAALAAAPLLEPPPEVLRRWHAALDQLPPPVAAHRGEATATRGRRGARGLAGARGMPGGRRRALSAGILASAAAVTALVGSPGPYQSVTGPPPVSLSRAELPDVAWTLRSGQPTVLGDQARLDGCLARLGAPGASVLGALRVDLQGQAGVLLALATPAPGRIRALVVTPDCGPDRGSALADRTGGR